MNFFLITLQSTLRTRLVSGRTWLLLLLPVLTFGAAWLMPPEEVSAPVQVGVVLPEEGGGDFWTRLEARSGLAISFLAAGPEQAERQVAIGRWDCALLLPEDFQDRLERLELAGLFTLLTGPGSAAYPLVRETVSACVAECVSPAMAEAYLLDSGITAPGDLEAVRPMLAETLLEQDRVLVSMETLDGRTLAPLALADQGLDKLLAGLTAILALLWTLFTAIDLGRWLDSPFAQRLAPLRGRLPLLLPQLAADLLPALAAGALALLVLERPLAAILALIPYLLFWGAAALILALRRSLWSSLPLLTPFVPLLGLLLALSAPWAPIALYLQACEGSWTSGLALTAAAAVLLGAAPLAEKQP